MHDELSCAGARTIRTWTIAWSAVIVLTSAAYSLCFTITRSGTAIAIGLLIGAVAGVAVAAYILMRGEHHAISKSFPKAQSQHDAYLTLRAEKFAIALGIPPPAVYQFFSESPNVAAFPWAGGTALMVSSAARYGLTERELDALMALQLRLRYDPNARRARPRVVASSYGSTYVQLLWLIGTPIGGLVNGHMLATVGWGFAATVVASSLFSQFRRLIRWGWVLLSDGVTVETTRYPQSLMHALRRIASHNGEQVAVRAWLGQADPYWVVPVNLRYSHTMYNQGKVVSRESSQMRNDAELLMRAMLVEDVCINGGPATEARWNAAAAVFRNLSLAAAEPGLAADGTAGGIRVGIDGMMDETIGPVHGSWVEGQPPPWPGPAQ